MTREICLFYREYLCDYVINPRANEGYEPGCLTFNQEKNEETLPLALVKYLKDNYGKRPTIVHLDKFCRQTHKSELEDRLKGTKIIVS